MTSQKLGTGGDGAVANGRRTRGRLSRRMGYSDRLGVGEAIKMTVGGADGEGGVMLAAAAAVVVVVVMRTQRARGRW